METSIRKQLQEELDIKIISKYGSPGGGCINEGEGFMTEQGPIYVKKNSKPEARKMFEGEFESLSALHRSNTIRVPKPMKVITNPKGGAILVTEYLDMKSSSRFSKEFGLGLARLHLKNCEVLAKHRDESHRVGSGRDERRDGDDLQPVSSFGFHVNTCCGFIPQKNEWNSSWSEFCIRNRLKPQVDMLIQNNGDRELLQLWPELERKTADLLKSCDEAVPSLLHGDLWSGNTAETVNEPVIFDPASFYGLSEWDFGIGKMFGGFSSDFFHAYHSLIPKAEGFDDRVRLYELFHHLNHWYFSCDHLFHVIPLHIKYFSYNIRFC